MANFATYINPINRALDISCGVFFTFVDIGCGWGQADSPPPVYLRQFWAIYLRQISYAGHFDVAVFC